MERKLSLMKTLKAGLLLLVFYFGVIARSECITNKAATDVKCNTNEWRCSNKQQCIPASYRCDVYVDCSDRSDEINCDKSTTKSSTKSTIKSTTLFATKSTSKSSIKPTSKFTTTIKPITNKGPIKCGLPAIQPISDNSRIVGGIPTKPHSWPWQVSLQFQSNHHCGGSIINETIIITAAHCFRNKDISKWTVVAGEDDFSTTTDGQTQTRSVKSLIIHAKYNDEPHANDIAILVLSSPLVFNDNISPICLPNVKVTQGENCFATGWGRIFDNDNLKREDKLRQVRLPIINQSICVSLRFYEAVPSTQICAGYLAGGKDTCQMDSGGPFVCQQSDKKWYLDGITSWGEGCGVKNQPGVYTRVFSYIDWIVEKTGFKL